jgi:hypothetical protein
VSLATNAANRSDDLAGVPPTSFLWGRHDARRNGAYASTCSTPRASARLQAPPMPAWKCPGGGDPAAAAAGPAFAKVAPCQRAEILRKCFELMIRDSEQLARLDLPGEWQGAERHPR